MTMLGVLLLLLLSPPAGADSSYAPSTGSSPCAALHELQAPPAPAAACVAFKASYLSLAAYSRDALNTCAQEEAKLGAANQQMSAACPAGPMGPACGQSMVDAEGKYGASESSLQAVITRNQAPVTASFPGQGQRISGNCLNLLDAYQGFTYSLTGAIQTGIHNLQTTRATIRQKALAGVSINKK